MIKIEKLVELLYRSDFKRLVLLNEVDLSDYAHDILFDIMFNDPMDCYEAFMKDKTEERRQTLKESLDQSKKLFDVCDYKTNTIFSQTSKDKILDSIKSVMKRDELFINLGSYNRDYYSPADVKAFFLKFANPSLVEFCVKMVDMNDFTYKSKPISKSCSLYFNYLISLIYTFPLTDEQIHKLVYSGNIDWSYDSYLFDLVIRYNEKSISNHYKTSFPFEFIYDTIMYSETIPVHKLIDLLNHVFKYRNHYHEEIASRSWFSDAEENLLKKHKSVEPFLIKITNTLGKHNTISDAILHYKDVDVIIGAIFWYIKNNLANENKSVILKECEKLAIELAQNDNHYCYILFCESFKKEKLADQIVLEDDKLNEIFHKKVNEHIEACEKYSNTEQNLKIDNSLMLRRPFAKRTRPSLNSFIPTAEFC